jgi:hypothetical protein
MPLAGATPSGIGLKNGRLLVAAERSPGNVRVQRLTATTATTLLDIEGYSEPYLTSDGIRAWLLMIRNSDGHVVSRMYDPVSGWTSTDHSEIGLEGGGDHQWPNADVADGRLRVLFRGPIQGNRSEVLAFQRVLD